MNSPLNLKMILGLLAAVVIGGCERPPMETQQTGYRGTGMDQITNPRLAVELPAIPEAPPPMSQEGPRAGDLLENVQVLGDLSITEFTRTMTAITAWVSPEEGCNYCHVPTDLASDELYTKVVSRRMLQMTRDLANNYGNHVGQTGVTCYTCHRGQPVPAAIWFADNSEAGASAFAGNRNGQNLPAESVAYAALPSDPFSTLLTAAGDTDPIRVLSTDYTPSDGGATIQSTEKTYGLMMHMSQALGVNCTFCHQTASFGDWKDSTPQRTTAYHGIGMVQHLNQEYLDPLVSVFPANRLGSAGDAPKVNCETCHGGLNKPLNGAQMAGEFPAFQAQ